MSSTGTKLRDGCLIGIGGESLPDDHPGPATGQYPLMFDLMSIFRTN